MEIIQKTIHLYSHEHETLIHFLSQVFDLDIDTQSDDYTVLFNDQLNFSIHKISKKKKASTFSDGAFIELKIESNEMLNNLKQKIEFIGYRDVGKESFSIVRKGDLLDFRDPDGRIWRLSL